VTAASPSRPLALGIHWAHDASAAICSPDGILSTIAEERLRRIKHYYGFPCLAIRKVLDTCGLTAADLDILAVSTRNVFYPQHPHRYTVGLDGRRAAAPFAGGLRGLFSRAAVAELGRRALRDRFASHNRLRERRMAAVRASWGEFAERHWVFQEPFLRELGLLDERVVHYYIHHHRAHAASAFRLSGFEEACVLSIDGKGDGISAAIFKGHSDGRLELRRAGGSAGRLGAV
jgi:carbamoyltransferase